VTSTNSLAGRRVLVIEDDFLIGMDFATSLEALGASVVGPVGNIDDALDLITDATELDGAVLDLNLGGEMSYPVADALVERDIPFVFTTGYDKLNIAPRFSQVVRCEKPVEISKIARALFG
jgi:CheY-like chemotaxis protein